MISERAQSVEAAATLAMSRLAKEMQAQGIDVINLGVGESDFQTPEHIAQAAIAAIQAHQTSFYTPTSGLNRCNRCLCDMFWCLEI